MDPLEHVKKLREEYERALDAAESRKVAYHEAVLDLYGSGIPLREIAQQLGLSHQRVHQIVSGEPPRKRDLKKAAAGGAAALVLLALLFNSLRLAHAAPFTSAVRIPQLSRATVQRVDSIAFRIARSNGDPNPRAFGISRSSGGPIHVILHGHFVCRGCNASTENATHIATITLALDPRTLAIIGLKKYRAGNWP